MINEEPGIPPGTFRPSPEEPLRPEIEPKSFEVESRPDLPDLVAKYSLFRERFKPKADVVYYPCSANDISPSIAFPDSRVIYVDIDEKSVDTLKRDGFEAYAASALEFDPGNVDILIMLNPTIPPDVPSSYVVENGFVLSNDCHGIASSLHRNKQYRLCAVIRTSKDKELILDTENLEDYWREIDTDEEFQNAPFDWKGVSFAKAAQVVEAVTGKKENILAEYKKIIAMAKEEQRQRNAQILTEHPELAEFMEDPDKENVLMFNHGGRQFVLATRFPRKKGTVDDIFVFQKVKPEFARRSHSKRS